MIFIETELVIQEHAESLWIRSLAIVHIYFFYLYRK